MDDASLEEFLDSEERETNEDTGSVAAAPQAAAEPAIPTVQWSPEGGDCEACGTSVDWRWHSDAGQVCAECKEW